ncbi:hypothetical protein AWB75_06542 [Caballeronia catudaia]|uniref:Uncharacterized protein n=1 Tax=Caballeronia catudaia TaxID=1777136 RepID=A0A158DDI4_9BURK|nr:hypothetical protein [Caballeronia catudaia]SAK92440.1 hypothetical protein AWB75_06542 [Caballeronia catudaia]
MADPYVDYISNRRTTTNPNPDSRHHVTVDIRYIRLPEDTHGWVDVRLESTGERKSLCEYTKVALVKDEGDRTYFQVLDGGIAKGKVVSMNSKAAKEYLQKTPSTKSTETLRVRYGRMSEENSPFKGRRLQQWATLTVGGQDITVTLNSAWDSTFTPIPPGTYRIMAPDYSHAKTSTEGYRNTYPGKIKANDVWFPIELQSGAGNSSRYVHIGHLSDGCVTVYDIDRWNTVYNFLISHRLPNTDGKYVALLEVTK